jgi:hypothetical protein
MLPPIFLIGKHYHLMAIFLSRHFDFFIPIDIGITINAHETFRPIGAFILTARALHLFLPFCL